MSTCIRYVHNMCVYTHRYIHVGGGAVYTHRGTGMMLYPRQGTEIVLVLVRVEYSAVHEYTPGVPYM